jgi:hypothetical protein
MVLNGSEVAVGVRVEVAWSGVGIEVGFGVANNGASSVGLVKMVSARRTMTSKMKALGFKAVP